MTGDLLESHGDLAPADLAHLDLDFTLARPLVLEKFLGDVYKPTGNPP